MSVEIEIPSHLLPSDGRFGSGPTRIRDSALKALVAANRSYLGTSHRQPAVKQMVGRIRSGLRELYSLPDDYEVVLGMGGATAFWDAAAFGLIESRSEHLVFGEFSAKFAKVVSGTPHLEAPLIVESEPGMGPQPVADRTVDSYCFTHNETTTGVATSIVRPSSSGLVLVDATSAAGAMMVAPDEFDAYYFSLQKAFGSEGGLWIALMSPAAVDRIEAIGEGDRYIPPFLALQRAVENSRKDQTPNTPALTTLLLMAEQLDWIVSGGGLEWSSDRARRNSSRVYEWAEAAEFTSPFVEVDSERSPTTATIDFHGIDALQVAAILRSNGILDVEPYRKLGRNQLRIGTWPAIPFEDIEALIASIEFVTGALGS